MGALPQMKERKYNIKFMWDKHHEVKRLALLGCQNKEISELLGVTPQNISDIRNSPIFKDQMKVMEVARDSATIDVARAIIEEGPKNLELLTKVRDSIEMDGQPVPLALRVNVAKDMLDRTPGTAKVRSITGNVHHSYGLDPKTVELIKDRARKAAIMDGAVREADISEAEIVE